VTGGLFGDGADRPDLRSLALPARLLLTFFLAGAAAALAAGEGTILAVHSGADGRPGVSMEDLRRTYHGREGWTLLASKVDGGSMEKHVPVPSEKAALLGWAAAGGTPEGFDAAKAVLDRRCVRCHSPGGEKSESPFAGSVEGGARHELVARFVEPDRGMSLEHRSVSTHTHLFSLSMLLALLGAAFLFTNTRPGTKVAVVCLAFGGMFLDIGSWWLALLSPAWVWGIVAGGAMMALGIVVLVVRPLWEMWGPAPKGLRV
jgi:hypothetical protein